MKRGDKCTVIDRSEIIQSYIPVGSVCEFIKSFDNYACVRFEGREYLMNKKLLVPINESPVT